MGGALTYQAAWMSESTLYKILKAIGAGWFGAPGQEVDVCVRRIAQRDKENGDHEDPAFAVICSPISLWIVSGSTRCWLVSG